MEEQTSIAVATAEPAIEAHPIEEMLALPEAESAVLAEQARARAREMSENFPAFLEYLFEERRDVYAGFTAPYMRSLAEFLNRPSAQEIDEYGLHVAKQEGQISTVYQPVVEWNREANPLEDLYQHYHRRESEWQGTFEGRAAYNAWDWAEYSGPAPETSAIRPITEEDAAAFEHARQALQERIAQAFMTPVDPEFARYSTPSGEPREPDRFDLALRPGGTTTVQILDSEGHVVQSFQASSIRFASTPSGNGSAIGGRPTYSFETTDAAAQRWTERAKALEEQNALESKFGLPTGTLSVYCMPARQSLDAIYDFMGQNPNASGECVKSFAARLEDLHRPALTTGMLIR